MYLYQTITTFAAQKRKMLALLIDPDKQNSHSQLITTIENANSAQVDFIFVGGSLISNSIDTIISTIKAQSQIPIILFPGSLLQISARADAILLLSLISGRNPDLLIGNHVLAAQLLKQSGLEILPTGYILIEGGKTTSVEYMSNTKPIPADKHDIAAATALAGEMLGLKLIYLETGSGASKSVSNEMITEVKRTISIPLIVGGGLRSTADIERVCLAGADVVVLGTAVEKDVSLLKSFSQTVHGIY